ncbi:MULTISPECIES: ABC transporter permease [Methylobacterium]|uniref:ABC-type dipeptide/oligopeptide/nickel transport systems, permease components n=2 Tax=Methylobacterium TaxID=407 RepID=A0A0C6FS10_9HYPH|nr:ABC transporter permease [Methylobacterium aquaticum]BAQ49817.1 ABC-type dipeptide/oligopeptide/nickel transport systems, permease components [Methylobacterium aquaticum]
MRAFLAHRLAPLGAFVTGLVALLVGLGPALSPYDPTHMDVLAFLMPPDWQHPFGTDALGRDVLTRVLAGARLSLAVSAAGVALAAFAGTLAGLIAAERGGLPAAVLLRLSDLLFSFPSFVLALFLVVVLGFGTGTLILAIALVYTPIFVRLSRNLAASARGQTYVAAARVIGQSSASILLREILPNIAGPLLVQATLGLAFGIVIEAGLSFIGLGVQPPQPSLGTIMAEGREVFGQAPWVLTLTGLFIAFTLLGLNLLGDGLRELADPKLRGRS